MENRKNTLLIADDSSYNIELLTEIFKEKYRILTAKNGQEALDVMRSNIGEIDAVLLDVVMPIKDGYQVLMDMNMDENLKYLPVIVITADDDIESEHRAFDYGAYDFITRPFNLKTMRQRVDGMFHQLDIEKMRTENDRLLKETETGKRLSALMDNLPGGVAIIETDGNTANCTYFNSSVPKLFHMTDDEFTAQFKEEERRDWLNTFVAKAGQGNKFDYAFSSEDKNGELCWIRLIASGIDRKGSKKALYCVFLDINAEKRHELHAAETEARLRENNINIENVISNAPGGIAMCEKGEDGSFHVLYSSKGLSDIFRYPDYDTYVSEVEKPERKMISDIEAEDFRTKMNNAITTGKPIEYTFHCRSYNLKPLWILVRAQFLKSDTGKLRLYCFISDATKEKEYEIELRNNAYFDSLTGLYNRSAFFFEAREMLKNNPDDDYAIYRINIGGFKVINDIMGREIGDKVLVSIATALNKTVSGKGLFSRFFADNFAVMVKEGTIAPEEIIKDIKEEVEDDCLVSQDVHYYIGVYHTGEREVPIEDMCDRANIACRSVTGNFQKHVAYYDEKMRAEMLEEQEIRDETHRAIVNGEFHIYYQPIYGIKAKKFVSAEALVRWLHPTKGIISPGKFIPIFERNGFIAELDLYVLEQVCKYQQKRRNLGLEPFPISVNISRMSLYNPNLYDIISRLADKYGVEPKYFRIEITETAYNDNPAQLLETVNRLREKCFPVLMDDFGSGYSSLNTLKDIPIDLLKLDMKFMQNFESNNRVGTIVTAIARMAKWLNVPLLAEGVETREQYEFLRSIGCAYIQGYYFAKPMPSSQFTDLIQLNGACLEEKELESYGMNLEINEILGSNSTVSKLIGGVFGGLGIYELYNDKLEVIRVNDGYMQIMGYSPVDFTGERYDIWGKVHPDDIEKSKNACLEASRTGKAVRVTVRRYDRNGKIRYLDGIHTRLGGTDENPIICIAFNDITEELEKDALIQKTNRRLDSILKITGSLAVDVDYTENEAFCAGFTGDFDFSDRELEEKLISGEGLESIAYPADREKMKLWHAGKESGRFSNEFRIRKKNGDYHWFHFIETRTFDENGNPLRTAGVIRDIDAEKSAYRHLEAIINNLKDGIALINITEGKPVLTYANEKFYSVLGIKEKDKKAVDSLLADVAKNGAGSMDITVPGADNAKRIVKVHTTEIKNEGHKDPSYITMLSDVTEKRAKEKNRLAERRSNAETGIYDEVFALDYEANTTQLVSSLRHPDRAMSSEPLEMNRTVSAWVNKYIHPSDRADARELFAAPVKNSDFTDGYTEVQILDPEDNNKYKRMGMTLVRSGRDTCVLFTKSASGSENATLSVSAKELDRLYKQISEQTDTTMIEMDHITDTLTCSSNIKRFAAGKLTEDQLKNKKIYVEGLTVHSDDKGIFEDFLREARTSEKPVYVTLRMKMADGEYKWCRISLSFIKDSGGKVIKSLCTINIVDEEIRAMRKLDESGEMLGKTVKHIPVGIGIYNVIDNVPVPVFISDTTYRIFGSEPGDEFRTERYLDFAKGKKLVDGLEDDCTYLSVKKDGTRFWVNVKYRVLNENGKTHIYAVVSDVSDRVESERYKEVQDRLYQLLLDETGTVVFDYNTESDTIVYYRHLGETDRKPNVINQLHSHPDEFTLLDGADKQEFICALDRLTDGKEAANPEDGGTEKGTEELSVMIEEEGGYKRHYRCRFKSIADKTGSVFRIIGKIEDVEDEIAKFDEIQAKAMYDSLCVDIYNKATTEEFIKNELKHTTGGALMMIDIDDFKSINDNLGHLFGDEFLKQFATTLKHVFRDSDIVGRYGGDEFFVFVSHANTAVAVKKGQVILERIAKINVPKIGRVKSSIGIAAVTPENRDYRQIVKQADSALYQAKNQGKNCVILFDPNTMNETVFRSTERESEKGEATVTLSSNPHSEASIIMRVFSALQSSSDIKVGINQMLALIGKHFDVSRAYIFEDSEDGLTCSNTFEWCGDGVKPERETLQGLSYEKDLGGMYHQSLNEDGILYCHDITSLDSAIANVLRRQGIKSVLHCSITEDGKFKGFVGFDECRENRFWTREQVDALTFISKILAVFLISDRNKNRSKNYSRSIETILYNYPEYIYIVEPETHALLYLNRLAEEIIGSDKLGLPCIKAVCGGKAPENCPLRLPEGRMGNPVDMISPLLNRKIKAQASEVEWCGKKAYMVSCLDIENL